MSGVQRVGVVVLGVLEGVRIRDASDQELYTGAVVRTNRTDVDSSTSDRKSGGFGELNGVSIDYDHKVGRISSQSSRESSSGRSVNRNLISSQITVGGDGNLVRQHGDIA